MTGAARGLGRAIALAFASEGAKVAVCDIGVADAGLVDDMKAAGSAGVYIVCDVADAKRVNEAVKSAMDTLGPIDILVNNAGIDRKSTRLNSSHIQKSRMPSSA